MKQEMNCDIIRDLLPLYLDDLASEASATAVRDHLEACEECRAIYEDMKKPLPVEADDSKAVDGLRRIRRSLKLRSIIIILLAVVIIGGLLKIFAFGTPITWHEAPIADTIYNEENGTVTLEGYIIPGRSVSRYKLAQIKGSNDYCLTIYTVPQSPLYPDSNYSITFPYDVDTSIYFEDRESGPVLIVSPYTFTTWIGFVGNDERGPGGWTGNRDRIRLIKEIVDNAKDTTIEQTGGPPTSNYFDIIIGSDAISISDYETEYRIVLYVHEMEGHYYLEEIKEFYGEEYEFRKNFYTRDIVESIANRKYVREISADKYSILMTIAQAVFEEENSR